VNKTNFLIDTAIFVAFLIAMEPRFGGLAVHEWLSLALAATIVVHLLLHWKWIVTVGAQFFRRLWHNSRLKFVVDSLLFIAFVAVVTSGVMISRVILPAFGVEIQAGRVWLWLHTESADLAVLLLGVHFALSWKWIWDRLNEYVGAPVGALLRPSRVKSPQMQLSTSTVKEH
jgi:hypothetical protein